MQTASGSVTRGGLVWGGLGVLAFSFTVVFTRVAVAQLDPLFVGAGRAVVAALLAGAALAITRSRVPSAAQMARLAIVGGGVVLGFPLLTSFALTSAPASHGAVVIAVLPAATAVAAVVRTRERPGRGFWIAASIGAVVAVTFALVGGSGGIHPSDLLLLGAVAAAAIGYAEGGVLSRELGSWQTISWALVLSSPVMVGLTVVAAVRTPVSADPVAWGAFAYLAVVSMFLGFVAWYRGLAIGPMARVSQLQLAQPVLSLAWAALLLGEQLTVATVVGGFAVIACAAIAVTIRQRPDAPGARPFGRREPARQPDGAGTRANGDLPVAQPGEERAGDDAQPVNVLPVNVLPVDVLPRDVQPVDVLPVDARAAESGAAQIGRRLTRSSR